MQNINFSASNSQYAACRVPWFSPPFRSRQWSSVWRTEGGTSLPTSSPTSRCNTWSDPPTLDHRCMTYRSTLQSSIADLADLLAARVGPPTVVVLHGRGRGSVRFRRAHTPRRDRPCSRSRSPCCSATPGPSAGTGSRTCSCSSCRWCARTRLASSCVVRRARCYLFGMLRIISVVRVSSCRRTFSMSST